MAGFSPGRTSSVAPRYSLRLLHLPVHYVLQQLVGHCKDVIDLPAVDEQRWRAAHIHLLVTGDGYVPLTTEVFDSASDYLDSDAVFGVAPELILDFVPDRDGIHTATFDIVLREAG